MKSSRNTSETYHIVSAVLAAGSIRSVLRSERVAARSVGDGVTDPGASGWVHPALRESGRPAAAAPRVVTGTIH